ncbi:hypothetical protein BJV82DRAFT_674576 [Fennellomyces sp. T-0311]|nr:hypothetical protein BJV82DRAFT_674576 [Fennellomyces sp. T-0311]
MPTLSLGYLTAPVSIEAQVHAKPYELPQTLSIVGFAPTPVRMLPTVAKYILSVDASTGMAEKETLALLAQSLASSYAIIPLSQQHVGILLPVQQDLFSLQVAQIPTHVSRTSEIPSFDPEYLKHLPMQVLDLCQKRQMDELCMVARGIYKIAAVYGYWDLWLVLEGICTRFQINPQDLMSPHSRE